VKPTEILLDLNDLKLGRIVKKDFEEAVVDIHAAKMAIEGPAPKFDPKAEVLPKFDPKVDPAPFVSPTVPISPGPVK
jgi:hypothetical protein